jgi:NhaP-type Na+/H+ or K+/H+ antiporter
MTKISGPALIVLGLLHILTALIMPNAIGFGGIWQEIVDVGILDAVKPDSLRIWGYYWFLVPGFLFILLGLLCYWIEYQLSQPLPAFLGWGLLIISCFCIVLDVDTGFWLVLLVAVNAIVASQRSIQLKQPDDVGM